MTALQLALCAWIGLGGAVLGLLVWLMRGKR